jgi:hypothetical protein
MTENDVEKDFRPAPWLTERLDHYTWRDWTAFSERTATQSRTTRQSQKANESLIRFQPRKLQQVYRQWRSHEQLLYIPYNLSPNRPQ